MFFFDVSLLVVMFGAIVLGIVLGAWRPGLLHHTAEAVAGDDEASYYIHRSSIAPEPTPLLKPAVKVAASALFLWLVPLRSSTFLSPTSIFGETSHYSSPRPPSLPLAARIQ